MCTLTVLLYTGTKIITWVHTRTVLPTSTLAPVLRSPVETRRVDSHLSFGDPALISIKVFFAQKDSILTLHIVEHIHVRKRSDDIVPLHICSFYKITVT